MTDTQTRVIITQYPRCIGPHCTGLPQSPPPPPPDIRHGFLPQQLVTSGGHHWWLVQSCSLKYPSPRPPLPRTPHYWYRVAKARTVGNWAVRILLECLLVLYHPTHQCKRDPVYMSMVLFISRVKRCKHRRSVRISLYTLFMRNECLC